ncbi:Ig-like domain-containing protein [Hornefia butyriciproducens]|uniref:Ig-like domain-containing protein n=1 Tax=Hornefia butyriciproducens TaxID=2652293 RepID=UPI002A90B385|nr:Ig-like domain-containing protein [Hornefia butyriciproducens]MCI7413759.1 Ig-like domain-containing protein [Clostridiales bacterium]MDY6211263.1 Ig-like domain-containing protein [Hornefia butyriciproducens]
MKVRGSMRKVTVLLLAMLMMITFMPSMAFAEDGTAAVRVKLDRHTLNLETGETAELTATVTPAQESTPQIEWSTSAKKVATVEDGRVTAVGQGIAEITAEYGGTEASCLVYVEKAATPDRISVKVKKGNVNLHRDTYFFSAVGENKSFQLEAAAEPEGASTKVTWSSNRSVCKIDEDGVVTVGSLTDAQYVTFTATSVHGNNLRGSINIYILPSVKWEKDVTVTIPENGAVKSFKSYALASPGQYRDYKLLDWKAENDTYFDIRYENENVCYVNPKQPGTAELTATDKYNKDNKASGNVTVKGFFVEDKEGTRNEGFVKKDASLQLTAKGVESGQITWTTENQAVATVDENGLVKGIGEGTTTIKAAWDQDGDGQADFTALYIMNVLDPDKCYAEKLYTDSTVFTDAGYKNRLNKEDRYIAEDTVQSAHYFPITDAADRTLYVANGTRSINLGSVFDKDKVSVELLQGDKKVSLSSGKETSVSLETGENKFSVKVSPASGTGKTVTYQFTVIRGYNSVDRLNSLSIAPADRDAASTEEGALSPRFSISKTAYTASVYKDITGVILSARAQDYTTGHLAYSTDGGATWKEDGGMLTTKKIPLSDEGKVTIQLRCVSEKAYNAAKAAGQDPFAGASKTYTIEVSRVNVDPDSVGVMNIRKIELGSGMTWCTPKWEKGFSQSAAVVGHDTDNAAVRYHITSGAKLYVNSVSDSNLQTSVGKDSDGNDIYEVTTKTPLSEQGGTYSQKVVVSAETAAGTTVAGTFSLNLYKVGTTKGVLRGIHDEIVDYLCPGSQYTSGGNQGWGTYGIFPEKINMGAGNWYSCISLGNFGGYITFKYDKAITDDPSHIYGVDFTVFGNSNGGTGFSEPGNVLVSEDGEKWYSLAGSEHYDAATIWNYSVTYKRNPTSAIADYEDNLGNSASLGTGWAPYRMPDKRWYPLHKFRDGEDKALTVTGVRMLGPNAPENKGLENSGVAAFPAFGYVDTHRNSSTTGGTGENVNLLEVPVGDPYVSGYDGYGDGFDLKWAVDENGDPVDSSKLKIHYVKVQTASFINGGAIGEKSTEVSAIVRTAESSSAYSQTEDPKITVGGKTLNLTKGRDVYYMTLDNADEYDVTVDAPGDANVYINNMRTTSRHYKGLPDKKMLRIITQTGTSEPSIKYIHLTTKGGDEKIEALAAIGEAEGSIDALPENPGADDYEQIVAARKAYDALPAESREKVSNLDKLEAAEKATLGVRVSRDIEALRNKEDVKSEDVEAVRKAYDALTETQRKDVTNYSDLLTLEKIVALQKELEESKKEISELKKQGEAAAAKEKAAEAAKKAKELKIAKAKKNKVTGLKLKKGKKSFKASWKKVPGVSGYRICYSTSKSFKKGCRYVVIKKSAKPKTSKSSAKKSSRRTKTVKGLKKKQKYYVRVQSFNTIDGVRVYGKWSASGSVRTK